MSQKAAHLDLIEFLLSLGQLEPGIQVLPRWLTVLGIYFHVASCFLCSSPGLLELCGSHGALRSGHASITQAPHQ